MSSRHPGRRILAVLMTAAVLCGMAAAPAAADMTKQASPFANAQVAASTTPVAPSMCPVIDLVELIGTFGACAPNARCTAARGASDNPAKRSSTTCIHQAVPIPTRVPAKRPSACARRGAW